jgi:hypothetical protein
MVETEFKMDIIYVRLIILNFLLCSYDGTTDVDHLHVQRIYLKSLVRHLYIVRED